jgi:hypothetical protein
MEYDEVEAFFEDIKMDDNIWEYPFGDLDDDDDLFYHKPEIVSKGSRTSTPASAFRRSSMGGQRLLP